jgi:hypothetical protein
LDVWVREGGILGEDGLAADAVDDVEVNWWSVGTRMVYTVCENTINK